MRRSPLYIVAAVVFLSSLLLAFTLPDKEPTFQHCLGTGTTAVDCIAIDHRVRERWSIGIAGAITAGVLVWISNRRPALSGGPPPAE